jgi:hypothetical protein
MMAQETIIVGSLNDTTFMNPVMLNHAMVEAV